MKKRGVYLLILLFLFCLPMYGCMSANERKYREWEKTLTAEEFKLHGMHVGYFSENGEGSLKAWDNYVFATLSGDDMVYSSVSMGLDTDLYYVVRPLMLSIEILTKGEQMRITISFDVGTKVEKIPATLHYTTVTGEQVSKDYVLDFTNPLFDFRES